MEKNSKNIRNIFLTIILLVTVIFGINNISKATNNDTSLKSLSIEPSNAELVQDEENKEIYRVKVNNNVTSIKVNAVPNNSNSKVSVEGNENLSIGTNKVTIKITAENGQSSEYIIYVRRESTPISEEPIIPNVQETVQIDNNKKEEQSSDKNQEIKNEVKNEVENKEIENNEQENLTANNELNDIENTEQYNENEEKSTTKLDNKTTNNFVFYIIILIILIILVVIFVVIKKNYKGLNSKH